MKKWPTSTCTLKYYNSKAPTINLCITQQQRRDEQKTQTNKIATNCNLQCDYIYILSYIKHTYIHQHLRIGMPLVQHVSGMHVLITCNRYLHFACSACLTPSAPLEPVRRQEELVSTVKEKVRCTLHMSCEISKKGQTRLKDLILGDRNEHT